AEPFGERRLGGDQGLLDVFAGVLAGGEEDVVVGVVGAGPLENFQVDLLANLGVHQRVFLAGWRSHRGLLGVGVIERRSFRMTAAATHCQPERSRRPSSLDGRVRLPGMRILALETATLAGSAALLEGGQVVGEIALNIALTHSERLMAM